MHKDDAQNNSTHLCRFFSEAKIIYFTILLLLCGIIFISLQPLFAHSYVLFVNNRSGNTGDENLKQDNARQLGRMEGQLNTATTVTSESRGRKIDVNTIPRDVYMLWDVGWERAPKWQKTCLRSWKYFNPTHTVHNLDLKSAEKKIDRQLLIGNATWSRLKIQAKSDVIRVLLLATYGGFWADASVACNKPLDKWVNYTDTFITFRRDDPVAKKGVGPKHKVISPWITSWFLAAQNTSLVIQRLREAILKFWLNPTFPHEYYWLHRLFANLVAHNTSFAKDVNVPNLLSGDGPHCKIGNLDQQPMFKRCNNEYVYKKMQETLNNQSNKSIT